MSPVSQRLIWLQPQALAHPGIESRSLEERGEERVTPEGGDAPGAALIPLCALPRRVPVTTSAPPAAVTSSRANPEVSRQPGHLSLPDPSCPAPAGLPASSWPLGQVPVLSPSRLSLPWSRCSCRGTCVTMLTFHQQDARGWGRGESTTIIENKWCIL